jgi:hypothetical protein
MSEVTNQKPLEKTVAPAFQTAPEPDERDFLLRTASVKLADVTLKFKQEIELAVEVRRPYLMRTALELLEVLNVMNKVLNGGGTAPPVDPPVAGSSGSADNSPMEARIGKLEDFAQDTRDRLVRIESRMDAFATKDDVSNLRIDMHKEFTAQTWKFVTWMTGICTALIAATYFIANHAK